MKFTGTKSNVVKFSTLSVAAVFRLASSTAGPYLKSEDGQVVNLISGFLGTCSPDDLVIEVQGSFVEEV